MRIIEKGRKREKRLFSLRPSASLLWLLDWVLVLVQLPVTEVARPGETCSQVLKGAKPLSSDPATHVLALFDNLEEMNGRKMKDILLVLSPVLLPWVACSLLMLLVELCCYAASQDMRTEKAKRKGQRVSCASSFLFVCDYVIFFWCAS